MSVKIIEEHITVDKPVKDKLREIAKREDRTMRAVATRLIEKEYENVNL